MMQRKHQRMSFNYEDWRAKRKIGQLSYVLWFYLLLRGLPGIIICAITMWFMGWNKYPLSPVYLTIILVISALTILSSIAAGILSWQRNEREYNKDQET